MPPNVAHLLLAHRSRQPEGDFGIASRAATVSTSAAKNGPMPRNTSCKVHHTEDGGETWRRCEEGFKFPDIHDIAVVDDDGACKLLAATAVGLYRSTDDGRSWQWNRLDSPWQYTRGLKPRADLNGTVFLCNGDGPPGSRGRLLRSRDWGESWEDANLPEPTNSTPWTVATNDADPNLLFACTNLGQMFRSMDGGEAWTKLPRELGEIRTMLWHP